MSKALRFVFVSFTVVLLGASVGFSQQWNKKQTEIWMVVVKSWSDWESGNHASVMASIHDNYQGWSNAQPLPLGKEQVSSMYQWMAANNKVQYHNLNIASIEVVKDVALVHYYFEFLNEFTEDDVTKRKTVKGKSTETYIKEGGDWLLLGDMTVIEEEEDDDD
jgi:hypothetical protein